jgi:tetratricopeptide (TPR) repeat protein
MRGARLVLLLLALGPVAARAQQPGDLERAKESFKAGATAYAAGEYLAAIQAFDAAYGLTPLPPIAFSLAQAERRQYFVGHERGHLDRAIALFRHYVEHVQTGGRRADALDALSQLEPLAIGKANEGAVEAEAARPTRVMLTCDAPGAELSLDAAASAPSPLIREVPAGAHQVTVSAPGFFPAQREVVAVAGELIPVSISLREQPSVLSVSAPGGAELYIDGTFAGRGGEPRRLELASGPHRMVVAQKGHRLSAQALELERGEARTVAVALQPTSQRRTANRLFIAGGLSLAAGAVLGGLTLHYESRAKDFLTKRTAGNVTAGELHDYDENVTARNRFRTASVIALGTSVGLLATALFLHELDNPEPQEFYRTPPGPEGDNRPTAERSARLHLRFEPVVADRTAAGAAVTGRF